MGMVATKRPPASNETAPAAWSLDPVNQRDGQRLSGRHADMTTKGTTIAAAARMPMVNFNARMLLTT